MVAGQSARNDAERSSKPPNKPRSSGRRQGEQSHSELPPLTLLTVSYEKLLPMIRDLSDFMWPKPIRANLAKRDHNKKCAYHKSMGILQSNAKVSITCRDSGTSSALVAPRVVINYIHEGPLDKEYDSKRKWQRLLRAASIYFDVRRILVDPGSSANLLQASVIKQMGLELSGIENPGRILSGFNGAATTSLGDVVLPVQAGPVILNIQFSIVEDLSPFNAILGRTWLHYMKAIPSTYHQMVSFLTEDGQIDLYDPLRTIQISEESTHLTHISSLLTLKEAWDIQVASHQLNILPSSRPVQQKDREVEYPDWLANVVVVPKKEGKWQVCVDYTNLNNACPKDSFPLPRINQIVDFTAGQGMLSFLDAFFEYHQILMAPANEEKTAFITPYGLYCYKVMSFGLKNVGATYQRLMTKIFRPLVGRTMEVYIDDIVVKSKTREDRAEILGVMVTQRGIEVRPDQIKAVMEVPPRNKRICSASQAS
ncbi:Transposon Ty3-I Gag-Pol polyprotein [Vitis vinifera]|uniref:Transposon Ty3-I Gag-Pol polyprotein n=1 Tax=Vitis vinifera TaxID=29760 RepID=A0A438GXP1_VITVI|nr:Transposon Ty3-I Gag-Pol polyprotein [Vitis vinifera]